jgi:hypothetical protein
MSDLIFSKQSKTMLSGTQNLFDKQQPIRDVLQKPAGYSILKRPQATKTDTRNMTAFFATFLGSFSL